jgi:hypothetical protein
MIIVDMLHFIFFTFNILLFLFYFTTLFKFPFLSYFLIIFSKVEPRQ